MWPVLYYSSCVVLYVFALMSQLWCFFFSFLSPVCACRSNRKGRRYEKVKKKLIVAGGLFDACKRKQMRRQAHTVSLETFFLTFTLARELSGIFFGHCGYNNVAQHEFIDLHTIFNDIIVQQTMMLSYINQHKQWNVGTNVVIARSAIAFSPIRFTL